MFRLNLKDLEDDSDGMAFERTHKHNTSVSVGGVILARVIEIINGYTVTFEDGQYAVNLVGANRNVADVVNINQVSVRSANSAGLQDLKIMLLKVDDIHNRLPNTYANDASNILNGDWTLTKTDNGDGTSTVQRS